MSRRASLQVDVPVGAPQQAVWDAVTDWPRQSEWIIGTDVRVVEGDGRSAGSRIAAYTGVRPFGVLGALGWQAAKPLVRWGFRRSLHRLAASLERERAHG